jgi:hypothetical protein
MKLPQLSLRELFVAVTCLAVSFALVATPPTVLSLQMARGLEVALVLLCAAVIVGGGWQRPFAIGFLLTLLLFFYFPERYNRTSYLTELLLKCFPSPSFRGTPAYGTWELVVDTVLGINVSLIGGLIAREARKAIERTNEP